MGKLFGGKTPKAPPPPAPPPPPPAEDTSAQDAMKLAEEGQRQRAAKGRASTILTGGDGLEDDQIVTAKKKLLGA